MQFFSANLGAHSFDTLAPAENSARSAFAGSNLSIASTVSYLSPNSTLAPSLLLEATGKILDESYFLSESMLSISRPTFPVAPTIAMFKLIN